MDPEVCRKLSAAGIDPVDSRPWVAVRLEEGSGRIAPAEKEGLWLATAGGLECPVSLKPLSQLFTGNAPAPDLGEVPPPAYISFFLMLETTAAAYCQARGCAPTDDEFNRLYKQLKSKPDGQDRSLLFGYLQAAARLYLSLHDVSRRELRAVLARLAKSAKTFRTDRRSCNYFDHAIVRLAEPALRALEAIQEEPW